MTAVTTQAPTRADGARPMPSALRVGLARARFEVRQFFREKDAVVFTFAFPIILLLIFGSVFGDTIAPGVTFSQYFVAGMIASGLLTSSFQNLAIRVAEERDDGTLKRLAGTPVQLAADAGLHPRRVSGQLLLAQLSLLPGLINPRNHSPSSCRPNRAGG